MFMHCDWCKKSYNKDSDREMCYYFYNLEVLAVLYTLRKDIPIFREIEIKSNISEMENKMQDREFFSNF